MNRPRNKTIHTGDRFSQLCYVKSATFRGPCAHVVAHKICRRRKSVIVRKKVATYGYAKNHACSQRITPERRGDSGYVQQCWDLRVSSVGSTARFIVRLIKEKPVRMGALDLTVTSDTANKDEPPLGYMTSERLKRFLLILPVNRQLFCCHAFLHDKVSEWYLNTENHFGVYKSLLCQAIQRVWPMMNILYGTAEKYAFIHCKFIMIYAHHVHFL